MAISLSINKVLPIKKEKCMRYVMHLAMPTITALSKFVVVEQRGSNNG